MAHPNIVENGDILSGFTETIVYLGRRVTFQLKLVDGVKDDGTPAQFAIIVPTVEGDVSGSALTGLTTCAQNIPSSSSTPPTPTPHRRPRINNTRVTKNRKRTKALDSESAPCPTIQNTAVPVLMDFDVDLLNEEYNDESPKQLTVLEPLDPILSHYDLVWAHGEMDRLLWGDGDNSDGDIGLGFGSEETYNNDDEDEGDNDSSENMTRVGEVYWGSGSVE